AQGHALHGGLRAVGVAHFQLGDFEEHGRILEVSCVESFRFASRPYAAIGACRMTTLPASGLSLLPIQRALRSIAPIVLALLLALPVLAVLGAWLPQAEGGAQSGAILREMAATVLPDYLWTTLWLGLSVAVGAAVVGTATAAAVTLFDFRGRRQLEWLLLLPLAMPAYV